MSYINIAGRTRILLFRLFRFCSKKILICVKLLLFFALYPLCSCCFLFSPHFLENCLVLWPTILCFCHTFSSCWNVWLKMLVQLQQVNCQVVGKKTQRLLFIIILTRWRYRQSRTIKRRVITWIQQKFIIFPN